MRKHWCSSHAFGGVPAGRGGSGSFSPPSPPFFFSSWSSIVICTFEGATKTLVCCNTQPFSSGLHLLVSRSPLFVWESGYARLGLRDYSHPERSIPTSCLPLWLWSALGFALAPERRIHRLWMQREQHLEAGFAEWQDSPWGAWLNSFGLFVHRLVKSAPH